MLHCPALPLWVGLAARFSIHIAGTAPSAWPVRLMYCPRPSLNVEGPTVIKTRRTYIHISAPPHPRPRYLSCTAHIPSPSNRQHGCLAVPRLLLRCTLASPVILHAPLDGNHLAHNQIARCLPNTATYPTALLRHQRPGTGTPQAGPACRRRLQVPPSLRAFDAPQR